MLVFRSVPVDVELRFAQLRFGLGKLRFGLVQNRLKGPRVNPKESLTLLDKGPFLIILCDDVSTDLRRDLRIDISGAF
jgi:hypothetical protein